MKASILDVPGEYRERLAQWLSESSKISSIDIFEDYLEFIKKLDVSQPALCFIRLGHKAIPGYKAAIIAQCLNQKLGIVYVKHKNDQAPEVNQTDAGGTLLYPFAKEQLDAVLTTLPSH
ncbi:MAG: hypothetical protein N2376_14010 [Clostridia bacterium]|nr:hypothetical protein [Clostridia bacterium]